MIGYKLSFVIILMLLFGGCQKQIPCEEKTTTFEISNNDKSRIPYSGYDTLTIMRTNDSSIHTFIGMGWNNGYDTYYTAEDCPQKEQKGSRYLLFRSSTFTQDIMIKHRIIENSSFFSVLDVLFQKTTLTFSHVDILGANNHASLKIQGKMYNEIDSFSNDDPVHPAVNYMCYYNLQFGILKMKLANGEVWELIEKK